MSIITFSGFEGGKSLYGGDPAFSIYSSSVTSPVKNGLRAGRLNVPSTEQGTFIVRGHNNTNGSVKNFDEDIIYAQFWFRYASKTTNNSGGIASLTTSDYGNGAFGLKLNSSGKIEIFNHTDTIVGSAGSTTLSVDTWYNIKIRAELNSTLLTVTYNVYIDEVSEFSGSYSVGSVSSNFNTLILGQYLPDNTSTGVDYYYDDVIVDSTNFHSTDATVLNLLANANGTTMQWTSGTGSSDYTQVDEIPPSGSDYVMSPTSGANPYTAQFLMQSCSSAGVSGTILAVRVGTETRENTSVVSATHQVSIWVGATNVKSTTTNGNTGLDQRWLFFSENPDTSSPWTISEVDSIQVGAIENNNVSVRMTGAIAMVLFEPLAPSTSSGNFLSVF